jgi:hypothetical protein
MKADLPEEFLRGILVTLIVETGVHTSNRSFEMIDTFENLEMCDIVLAERKLRSLHEQNNIQAVPKLRTYRLIKQEYQT